MVVKRLITLRSGPNVIKLLGPLFTNVRNKLECSSFASLFQPSVKFVSKAGAYQS